MIATPKKGLNNQWIKKRATTEIVEKTVSNFSSIEQDCVIGQSLMVIMR